MMNKFVRCRDGIDEGCASTPKAAYEQYRINNGRNSPQDCSYERVEVLSIEVQWVEVVPDADIKLGGD